MVVLYSISWYRKKETRVCINITSNMYATSAELVFSRFVPVSSLLSAFINEEAIDWGRLLLESLWDSRYLSGFD